MTETLVTLAVVSVLLAVALYLLLRGANTPFPPVEVPKPPAPAPKPLVVTKIREVLPTKIAQQLEAIEQQLRKPAPLAPVPQPPPAPVPVPAPAPTRERAPATVKLRLVSAKGRLLTKEPIVLDTRARRPVLRHRTKDGLLSVFVAEGQGADGVWVYRRTGVEREQ